VLEHFPENTETDLYLFVIDYLHRLREVYGAEAVDPSQAVEELQKELPAGRRASSLREHAKGAGSKDKKRLEDA
jgi:hypothetical protein